MKNKFIFFTLATSMLTSQAYSHELIDEIIVMGSNENIVYDVVQSYDLSKEDIISATLPSARISYGSILNPVPPNQQFETHAHIDGSSHSVVQGDTCGQFDDFSTARIIAVNTCDKLNHTTFGNYPAGLYPRFLSPETFITQGTAGPTAAEDHHDLYKIRHGIKFQCVHATSARQDTYNEGRN